METSQRSLQNQSDPRISKFVMLLIILQPPLDVLSYFMVERGSQAVSTMIRFAFLALVGFGGLFLSEKKKPYVLLYGAIAGFWVLHVANCYRVGYQSVYADTANYLRIISLPVYTMAFVTMLQKAGDGKRLVALGFFINFLSIVLFTVLPWVMGNRIYTYPYPVEVGMMGWFSVKSAQSAIIAIVTPLAIFFGYRSKKYWLYLTMTVATMVLIYVTGTKLTYYTAFLVCGAYLFLFLLNLQKRGIKYVLPLLVLLVCFVLLKPYSPMQDRENQSNHALGVYNSDIKNALSASGADEDLQEALETGDFTSLGKEKKLHPSVVKERMRKAIFGVYTDKDLYGTIYKGINERFGVYSVMETYAYTIDPTILSDSRERKKYFAKLIWEEKDFLTKLFGIEYLDMLSGTENYDLENDFPAVFYFCGYIGFALYMLFFLYFIAIVLRAFIKHWKDFLTVEMGAVGMTFLLGVAAAQISANVLRRPNVTVYFALVAAYLYLLIQEFGDGRLVLRKGRRKGEKDLEKP